MKRLEVNQTIIPEKKRLLHHWEKVLESGKLTNNQAEVQSFSERIESKLSPISRLGGLFGNHGFTPFDSGIRPT